MIFYFFISLKTLFHSPQVSLIFGRDMHCEPVLVSVYNICFIAFFIFYFDSLPNTNETLAASCYKMI